MLSDIVMPSLSRLELGRLIREQSHANGPKLVRAVYRCIIFQVMSRQTNALESDMRILAVVGGLAIIVGIGAAIFFFGGFYSVAGTAEDPAIIHWALTQVRTASINRYAHDQPPPAINIRDPATIQAGAKAFAAHGCTNCHGAPGMAWAKFSEGLHPDPPDLKE